MKISTLQKIGVLLLFVNILLAVLVFSKSISNFRADTTLVASNQSYYQCFDNALWWYDTNNQRTEKYSDCPVGCIAGSDICAAPQFVDSHVEKKCVGNAIYWFNSNGEQEDMYEFCGDSEAKTLSCRGGNLYTNVTNYSCNPISVKCESSASEILEERCSFGCENKKCLKAAIGCLSDSDCGPSKAERFCRGNKVYEKKIVESCVLPGRERSECKSNVESERLITSCSTSCLNGKCQSGSKEYNYKDCHLGDVWGFDTNDRPIKFIEKCDKCSLGRCVTKSSTTKKAGQFSDLPPSHWAHDFVMDLVSQGYISGYPDGSFRPDGPLNRAEALKLIISPDDINHHATYPNVLTDIERDAWYVPFLKTAFEKTIIQGYRDNTFRPARQISRAEFLKIVLLRTGFTMVASNKSPFNDVPSHAWYATIVETARLYKIVNGCSATQFCPDRKITRAEAAKIVSNTIKLLSK